jgi:hypothetical protein
MTEQPGLVVLFGSGETSTSGRKVWDWLFQQLPRQMQVAILETPAGFQPNSDRVAGRIAEFVQHHLQNYRPQVTVVPARQRDTHFSPDDPEILKPMLDADMLFLGPGSPTYAVRQLEASLAWKILTARHRMGAAVVFASAAAVAAGAYALPVYEIYKVGEDLFWHSGLDFLARFGLAPTFIPHWNNTEGGAELDTSHCYMGRARFTELLNLLPANATIVGLDEHTALIVDLAGGACRVMGLGEVTLLNAGETRRFVAGTTFDLAELGAWQMPAPDDDIHPDMLALIRGVQGEQPASSEPPPEVQTLAEQRAAARVSEDWETADRLRDQIAALGWKVRDTREGSALVPILED